MSTFNDFINFIKDMGPSPVQYGRNGVLSSQPTKEVGHAGGTGAVANRKPPTLSESSCGHGAQRDAATSGGHDGPVAPPCGRATETPAGADGRLDDGRVQSLSVELQYLCEGPDCYRVIATSCEPLRCEECGEHPVLCSECYDEHMEAGHVSDAMTMRERIGG